jgi:uncharacterized protein involved in cysteine biosynthesis
LDTETKLKILAAVAIIFGIYMILDGFGSNLVYWAQPLIPDHFVRLCRMIAGLIEIVLAIVIVYLWGQLSRVMWRSIDSI